MRVKMLNKGKAHISWLVTEWISMYQDNIILDNSVLNEKYCTILLFCRLVFSSGYHFVWCVDIIYLRHLLMPLKPEYSSAYICLTLE